MLSAANASSCFIKNFHFRRRAGELQRDELLACSGSNPLPESPD
jgi:hypothetical protein